MRGISHHLHLSFNEEELSPAVPLFNNFSFIAFSFSLQVNRYFQDSTLMHLNTLPVKKTFNHLLEAF